MNLAEHHRPAECATQGLPDCMGRLGAIEAKIDILLQNRTDVETRLRILERRDAYVVCVCAIVSFGAPFLIKYFSHR